ncbi:MAG: hypothetical protein D6736_00840, partial [Nitrospinota bacterium]
RGEFINFPPEELDPLYRYVQEQGLSFGIHLPLFQPSWLAEKGLYLALIDHSAERRELFFRLVEENLQWGKRWGADYLLVHLQRVMLFDHLQNGDFSIREAEAIAQAGVARLESLAQRYGIPIVLENALGCRFFYHVEQYLSLFENSSWLRFCLDIGHLLIDASLYDFCAEEFIQQLAPYTQEIHLYNKPVIGKLTEISFEKFQELRQKFPVHPSQTPAEGWNDTEAVLRIILRRRPDCLITFESHPSLYPDYRYTQEGIQWVKALCRQILTG